MCQKWMTTGHLPVHGRTPGTHTHTKPGCRDTGFKLTPGEFRHIMWSKYQHSSTLSCVNRISPFTIACTNIGRWMCVCIVCENLVSWGGYNISKNAVVGTCSEKLGVPLFSKLEFFKVLMWCLNPQQERKNACSVWVVVGGKDARGCIEARSQDIYPFF